jgi:transposase-like protein
MTEFSARYSISSARKINDPEFVRHDAALRDILNSDNLSRKMLESTRWPQGPVCLRCGAIDMACKVTTRQGLWTCKACRACQFSVTSGTPLHGTRVALSCWLQLIYHRRIRRARMSISQTARCFRVSYQTAKSMNARIDDLVREMPLFVERLEGSLRGLDGDEASWVPDIQRE